MGENGPMFSSVRCISLAGHGFFSAGLSSKSLIVEAEVSLSGHTAANSSESPKMSRKQDELEVDAELTAVQGHDGLRAQEQ
jgi:hypothetical protein